MEVVAAENSLIPRLPKEVDSISCDNESESSIDVESYTLPDGWPKIPEISVLASWDFTTATHPSINKAIAHLEVLQNTLQGWSSHKTGHLPNSQPPVEQNEVTAVQSGRKQMKFTTNRKDESLHAELLSVQGVGGFRYPVDSVEKNVTFLGADDISAEVVTLLAKLENDRRETKKSLEQEKKRVEMLSANIDKLLEQRLLTLPQAVQKEHEACAMDISELAWHVSYRSRTEDNRRSTFNTTEQLNSRLKSSIEHVAEHSPLVEEKLSLESEAIDRIKEAQTETDKELERMKERCNKVTSKSSQTHSKANKERQDVESDLDSVRKTLQSVSEELSDAQKLYESYIQLCSDCRKRIKNNKQESLILQVKNDNARSSEALQAAKVHDLTTQIMEEQERCTELQQEIAQITSQLENQQQSISEEKDSLRLCLVTKEDELQEATRTTEEAMMNIQDINTKLDDCDKQKIADEKNLSRMTKETGRIQESIKLTEGQLTSVQAANKVVTGKFRKTQNQALNKEANLKTKEEAIKQQIKEEIQSRLLLRAQLDAEATDLERDKLDTKRKKDKISKNLEDVEVVVKSFSRQVHGLETVHEEKAKAITNLQEETQQLEVETMKLLKSTEDTLSALQPKQKECKDNLLAIEKQLAEMEWNANLMRENMTDMDKMSKVMERTLSKTRIAIEQNQSKFDELTVKVEAGKHKRDLLGSQLAQVCDRVESDDLLHNKMMENRNVVREQYQNDLGLNLSQNKGLAAKYRRLQEERFSLKNEMLNRLDDRVKAEMCVKDLKKVQGLQQRMRAALGMYYQLRTWYNQGELSKMEMESTKRDKKVGQLKGNIESTLNSMGDYLRAQFETRPARHERTSKDAENMTRSANYVTINEVSSQTQPENIVF